MWHSMPAANEETLQQLTDQFNASQGDVQVKLVNQTSYDDTLTKYRAGLGERRPARPRADRGHRRSSR